MVIIKNKKLNIIIFILSSVCLIISIKLFYNMGIFVDEFNISPDRVCGGVSWLYMDWLRLALNLIICIISGVSLVSKKS